MKVFDYFKKLLQKLLDTDCSPAEAKQSFPNADGLDEFEIAFRDTSCEFSRLHQQGNAYYLTEKRPFSRRGKLKAETIEKVFDFAYEMAFTDKHRNTRS